MEDDTTTGVEKLEENSSTVKRKSFGQQSICKFFCPLNSDRPLGHLQQPKQGKVRCCQLWDLEVVKHFKDDCQIRRWTAKSLYKQKIDSGEICRFQSWEGHENCCDYNHWCVKHPLNAKEISIQANESNRSSTNPLNFFPILTLLA